MNVTERSISTPDERAVFEMIRRTALDFERLGISRLEDACNSERSVLLGLAQAGGTIARHGSVLDAALVTRELTPPFHLELLPDELGIDFSQRVSPYRSNCPMTTDGPIVWIHMEYIDASQGWCPTVSMSVADTMLHELLHVCGERQFDGIIRYNWAGVFVIRELLSQLDW